MNTLLIYTIKYKQLAGLIKKSSQSAAAIFNNWFLIKNTFLIHDMLPSQRQASSWFDWQGRGRGGGEGGGGIILVLARLQLTYEQKWQAMEKYLYYLLSQVCVFVVKTPKLLTKLYWAFYVCNLILKFRRWVQFVFKENFNEE